VFPVRYELDSYILFRRNSVFRGLISATRKERQGTKYLHFPHSKFFKQQNETACCLPVLLSGVSLGLLFDTEDGDNMFLRNVGLSLHYTASQLRR
jgi:hypothetical protein